MNDAIVQISIGEFFIKLTSMRFRGNDKRSKLRGIEPTPNKGIASRIKKRKFDAELTQLFYPGD